jgi:hypothetical protein
MCDPRLFLLQAALVASMLAIDAAGQQGRVDATQLMHDVEVLASDDMEGRRVGTPGSARAREYLVRRFKESGIEPIGESYERPFQFEGQGGTGAGAGVNVIGVIRGRRTPDRFIAVTAHYDHLGVRNGQIYNGADDNATGVAAVLALGTYFSRNPPDHSLLVAAFDAEESGLRGATHLVTRGPVPASAFAINVNIDMIGRDDGGVLYAAGTSHYPFLKPLLEGVAHPPVTLRLGHDTPGGTSEDWTNASDHHAFHRSGVPFLYFGVENVEHHHKPTDDVSTIQRAFFAGAVSTILTVIERIDAAAGRWKSARERPVAAVQESRSLRTVSSVSASSGFLSLRQRSMRGNRTATPERCRVDRAIPSNPSSNT